MTNNKCLSAACGVVAVAHAWWWLVHEVGTEPCPHHLAEV